jgi:hypothetical protein
MMGWILRRVKWLTLALMAAPFIVAFVAYSGASETNEMRKDGVEAVADIEGGKRTKRRRSGTSFSLNLSWKDQAGKDRTATGVSIPRAVADRLIVDDALVADTIRIVYLPNDPERKPVLAETLGKGGAEPVTESLTAALSMVPTALIGGALFFFLRRREQRQTDA